MFGRSIRDWVVLMCSLYKEVFIALFMSLTCISWIHTGRTRLGTDPQSIRTWHSEFDKNVFSTLTLDQIGRKVRQYPQNLRRTYVILCSFGNQSMNLVLPGKRGRLVTLVITLHSLILVQLSIFNSCPIFAVVLV